MYSGLSQEEARQRILEFGYNEIPNPKSRKLFNLIAEAVKEPIFLLLLGCATIYILIGETAEGLVLLFWVLFTVVLTFYQHRKTERALESLRNLSAPRAMVIRDGKSNRIPGGEVVPGDIIQLNSGDRIPADGKVLESLNLMVDEAILTGESIAVHKAQSHSEETENKVYSGTLVVSGRGVYKVTQTGGQTAFGKIGKSLGDITEAKSQIHKEIKILTRNLLIAGISLSLLVCLAFLVTRGNFIQAILNGLATAMAMLPEEFPVVLTVFLALGAWRLTKINVLVRRPAAIETLGTATVLCSDKTGTITSNSMALVTVVPGLQTDTHKTIHFKEDKIQEVVQTALRASQEQPTDPMERAIIKSSELGTNDVDPTGSLFKEYPLTSESPMLIRVYEYGLDQYTIYCKGAPERVLQQCNLDVEVKELILNQIRQLAQMGQRVLGVAHAKIKRENLPESASNLKLNWVGLLGFEDPIRPEVPEAIQHCNKAGIRVILITGDYPETAQSIAKQAGLTLTQAAFTGDLMDQLNPEDFTRTIVSSNVFARIRPEQKLRLVEALQKQGAVVAMTGDGVNDAPALKQADIGIAMGEKGTDVARESADLVLLDDNFKSIVAAIRMGRKIFDNLQKALSYITAIHIPIIGLTLVPAFFSEIPVLLLPLHIVFLELIIDPVCALAFESEQEELDLMQRPPRNPSVSFFGLNNFLQSVWSGALLWSMVLVVVLITMKQGYSEGQIRALGFTTLILGNVFLIFTTLTKTRGLWRTITEKNKVLWAILTTAVALLTAILFIPYLRDIFGFEMLDFWSFLISLSGALGVLLILEVTRRLVKQFGLKISGFTQ